MNLSIHITFVGQKQDLEKALLDIARQIKRQVEEEPENTIVNDYALASYQAEELVNPRMN